jgi:hypothetical protein
MLDKPRPWTVLQHDPIQKLTPDLWNVDAEIPGMPLRRRMVLMRLPDARLIVHNGVALDDASMDELKAWGEPAFLIVPNGWHRLDAHAWAERFPRMQVLCPPEAKQRVAQQVRVDGDYGALPLSDDFHVERIEGGKAGEAAFLWRSGGEWTAVFADMLFNNTIGKGFWWFMYRLSDSTGGPKVTRLAKLATVRDKSAVAAHYQRLAELPGLTRVIPGHGAILQGDAAADGLRAAALGLA